MHNIDFKELTRFFSEDLDGDQEIFDSLIHILEEQFSEFLAYRFAIDDLEALARMAHKFRSGARSFAMAEIDSALSKLEELCKDNNHEGASDEFLKIQEKMPFAIRELYECRNKLIPVVQCG